MLRRAVSATLATGRRGFSTSSGTSRRVRRTPRPQCPARRSWRPKLLPRPRYRPMLGWSVQPSRRSWMLVVAANIQLPPSHSRTCIAARLATEGLDWQDAFKLDSQLTDEER